MSKEYQLKRNSVYAIAHKEEIWYIMYEQAGRLGFKFDQYRFGRGGEIGFSKKMFDQSKARIFKNNKGESFEMKKKSLATMAVTAGIILSASFNSFAGQWVYDGPESYQWWYQEDDGSYPASAWKEVDGKWYHFDENGYLDLGWQFIDGSYYFFDESGAMATSGTWEGGNILPDGSLNMWYVGREYDQSREYDNMQISYVDELTYSENPTLHPVADWKKNIFSTISEATAELWQNYSGETKTYSFDFQVPANWYEEFPAPLLGPLVNNPLYEFRTDLYRIKDCPYSTDGTNLHIELTVEPNEYDELGNPV